MHVAFFKERVVEGSMLLQSASTGDEAGREVDTQNVLVFLSHLEYGTTYRASQIHRAVYLSTFGDPQTLLSDSDRKIERYAEEERRGGVRRRHSESETGKKYTFFGSKGIRKVQLRFSILKYKNREVRISLLIRDEYIHGTACIELQGRLFHTWDWV